MKKLIAGALLLGSISSFSEIVDVGTNGEIIFEVTRSLRNGDLKCLDSINDREFPASEFNLAAILSIDFSLELRRDSQPVIYVKKDFKRVKDGQFFYAKVTTDSEYRNVIGLTARVVQTYPSKTEDRINVGTIINPVYKNVITPVPDKLLQNITCK